MIRSWIIILVKQHFVTKNYWSGANVWSSQWVVLGTGSFWKPWTAGQQIQSLMLSCKLVFREFTEYCSLAEVKSFYSYCFVLMLHQKSLPHPHCKLFYLVWTQLDKTRWTVHVVSKRQGYMDHHSNVIQELQKDSVQQQQKTT